jgi:glycosyltransferase involved in cell wall biosynthesis
MKILFCNYEYPPLGGGGGVINKLIAEELAKRHEVTILTSQGLGAPKHAVENGVNVIRVPVFFRNRLAAANFPSMMAFLPMGYIAGKKLLEHGDFDVINTHFVLPTGPLGDWLARSKNLPNVLSVHGGDLYDPSKKTSPHRHAILRNTVKKLLAHADIVVGQSSNTIQNVHQYYISDLPCECVPLGIVRPSNNAVARRTQYNLADDDIVLVTVGRLVPRKAVDQLIKIIKELNNKKVKLVVIGSGPEQPFLIKSAQELNVQDQVQFLGQVGEDEKFAILRMSDMYVSTSQHEGFGIVYLEAMAFKLPVVCYDYGGQTDFLKSEETGFVVNLNNKEKFKAACARLINDEALRKRISEHNANAVEEYYIERCAQRYENIFQKAIDQHKVRGSLVGNPNRS